MAILRFDNVSLTYGDVPLLAGVDFQIETGERVCLVGRNGAGKSSFLRLIAEIAPPDSGEIWRREPLRVAHLEQEVPPDTDQTVFAVVSGGLGELGSMLAEFHELTQQPGAIDKSVLDRMARLQSRIEFSDAWNIGRKVETVLTRLNLPADDRLSGCSGGTRRQVMLARALVNEPDLLLLDEPTNHLDIAAITWLEKFLLGYRGTLIFITHDRTFVRRLATRIVELDRGKLTSFPGDFDHYLRKKDELEEIEARALAKFDKRLAEEEAWIRRGIKARRTRNEGRVKALQALRLQRASRLEAPSTARFNINAADLSGKLVVDMREVMFRYGERLVISELSTRILRGDRVGIIGPNGCGKSTLLKLILGKITPTSGQVVTGTRLKVAYFDQHRRLLDPDKTVTENLSDSDYVTVKGRSRHVIGYLKDFLFAPQRADSPVKSLSGGERNRLMLAKLFTQPANVMVMDEPTNDLDVDTLELLEDLLADYKGTLLLVSHDRTFLDNVVTSTLVFEGHGRFGEYAGGYEDWERCRRAANSRQSVSGRSSRLSEEAPPQQPNHAARGLTYRERRELEALPGQIESLEAEEAELHRLMASGDFYRQPAEAISAAVKRLNALKSQLESCYERWESLENAALDGK